MSSPATSELYRQTGKTDRTLSRIHACDNCKTRKIKCDKGAPCSSCVTSELTCHTTKRPPEKKQRVLLSKKHGDEIAQVNRRLSDLSETIKALVESNSKIAGASPISQVISSIATSSKTESPGVPFEGNTSFSSHSKDITDALEDALSESRHVFSGTQSSNGASLQSLLQDVATSVRSRPVGLPSFDKYPELARYELPPMNPVLKLLRLANQEFQRFFLDNPLVIIKSFEHDCRSVYFPTEEYHLVTWTRVNFGLFNLFRSLDTKNLPILGISRHDTQVFADLCGSNVLSCVQDLSITLEPTLNNVEILSHAAFLAVDTSKAALAWRLTAAAARLCLDLGIHHQPIGSRGPEARRERLLFWPLYALDKGLSLNFGRTPNMRDYDMTIEYPVVPDDLDGEFAEYHLAWIRFAKIQGDVYDQLFCAAAQKQPLQMRKSRVHDLAARCTALIAELEDFEPVKDVPNLLKRDTLLLADLSLNTLLTLIYRALPPAAGAHPLQFSDECLKAARKSLVSMANTPRAFDTGDDEAWRLFVNWTVVLIPFIPFIVVFGNTIAERSLDDLALLRSAVQTLWAASRVAPAIVKLRDACEKFCELASAYLAQTRPAEPASSSQADGSVSSLKDMPLLDNNISESRALLDFTTQQGVWDNILNEWDLGLGAGSAREMTDWFGQYANLGAMELS